jgi:hypothetical protein
MHGDYGVCANRSNEADGQDGQFGQGDEQKYRARREKILEIIMPREYSEKRMIVYYSIRIVVIISYEIIVSTDTPPPLAHRRNIRRTYCVLETQFTASDYYTRS